MGKYGLSEKKYQELFSKLNPDQREVVLHQGGPALTLSGAGGGKTATIVARIFHLIHKRDIKPSSILAITLTKKAAEEMKTRMADVLEANPEVADLIKFRTIHSFAMDLYNKTMVAMDPCYVKPEIMSAKIGAFWGAFIKLATKSETNLYSVDMDFYRTEVGFMKRSMMSIEKYAENNRLMENGKIKFDLMNRKGKLVYSRESSVVVFYNFYEKWKRDNNAMDFDDMLLFCLDCLTDPRKRKYAEPYLQRLNEILVDEVQDSTSVSFLIIDELMKATQNITLTGDSRQNIFSFAGADPKNIISFKNRYQPTIMDLRINYRSTDTIVKNANQLISKATTQLLGAPSVAANQTTDKPIDIFVSENETMEADKLTAEISYLITESGVQPRDITVLYRVHSQAVAIEDAMFAAKIPYYSYSKRAFYERKEVLDVMAYLKVLSDPMRVTKTEFKRIMNKPNNFLSATVLEEIFQNKKENKCSVLSAMQMCEDNGWASQNIFKFHSRLMAGIKFAASAESVDKVVDYILNNMGYLDYMKEVLEIRDTETDVEGNFDAIRGSASRFKDIPSFLEHIDDLKSESDKDENGNYVKLMTIHAAKGREYHHIFVAGICDHLYPFYRCETNEDIEEERRIMYVAITRPKTELHLSVISGKYGRINVAPSKFIFDMNVDLAAAMRRDLTGGQHGKEI